MINGVTKVEANNTYGGNTSIAGAESTSDFSSYLGESQSLDAIFDEAAEKYNVPVELLKAVGKAESNFNTTAVSRCGAQGIMQLMPSTAKGLGVTDAFDARQNIMGGAKYLSGLLKKYDGNVSLALAAYNAGSGNVAKYGGIPPFDETQNYVKKVLGYMKQAGTDTSGDATDVNAASDSTESYLRVAALKLPTRVSENYAYLLNGGGTGDSEADLQELFTYDDYMKFLELFLKDENEAASDEDNKNYSAQDISYNAAVLNLLTAQITE
jgi:hypothetical protein